MLSVMAVKTILQIMNLAAYANEANECDGIIMQQK